jgi:hypothetical protein
VKLELQLAPREQAKRRRRFDQERAQVATLAAKVPEETGESLHHVKVKNTLQALGRPRFGSAKVLAAAAPLTGLRINEWLAAPVSGADFFELFNTGVQSVALGGNYLADSLLDRTRHLIPALSFVGGSGSARWQRWTADGNNSDTPEHVNIELRGDSGGSIGLFTTLSAAGRRFYRIVTPAVPWIARCVAEGCETGFRSAPRRPPARTMLR